jgi:hypothetical protein
MVCKETQWERWQWHSLPDSGTDVTGMGHAVETQTSPQNETIHSGMRMGRARCVPELELYV